MTRHVGSGHESKERYDIFVFHCSPEPCFSKEFLSWGRYQFLNLNGSKGLPVIDPLTSLNCFASSVVKALLITLMATLIQNLKLMVIEAIIDPKELPCWFSAWDRCILPTRCLHDYRHQRDVDQLCESQR